MAKKEFVGIVKSNKMQKTVVVEVALLKMHSLYGKTVKATRRFKAHVPENLKVENGKRVKIISTRPLSSGKKWLVKEVL